MTHQAALAFYVVVLWGAILGIVAPRTSRSWVCRWSKVLAGVAFVCLCVEVGRYGLTDY